jgi:hypothetical protein
MEHFANAGWIVAAGLIVSVFGYFLGRYHGSNNCATCGIGELKAEISRLCCLVESLWEKAGLTIKERLEVEALSGEKQ